MAETGPAAVKKLPPGLRGCNVRAWVLAGATAVLLLAAAAGLSTLRQRIGVNATLLRLLADAPALESLRSHWYGVGVRHLSAQQAASVLSVYSDNAAQQPCRSWERPALAVADTWLPPAADLSADPMALLLRARAEECGGDVAEAARILAVEPLPPALLGPAIGPQMLAGDQLSARATLERYLCAPNADWCPGYVTALLAGWYKGPQFAPITMDLAASPGVIVERQRPLVVSGVSAAAGSDNYVAFATLDIPSTAHAISFVTHGEVLGSAARCLSQRLVFFQDDEYLTESSQLATVESNFEAVYARQIPPGATSVTPRLTYSPECFGSGQSPAIYLVQVQFEDKH
jgi:hypothetical protein